MSAAAHASLLALFHWVEDLGLLATIGSIVVRRLGRLRPRLEWVEPAMAKALAVAVAGGVALLLMAPSWQGALRVGCEAAALWLCVRGVPYVWAAVIPAVALLPLTGHAAAAPAPAAGAEFADAIHVLSAGMWGGGIVMLGTLRPPDGWRGEEGRALLERFGRVALIAFGVTALTGVIRATEQLTAPSDLWTTTYGAVLLLKTAAVAIMVALSIAWRRGYPAARADATAAVLVVAATAALAALPPPA